MNDDLKKLYDAVSTKFDVGDYNSFVSKMSTTEDRKKFYDVVGSKGFDLGDYNQFETRLGGSKKKEVTEATSEVSGVGAPQSGASSEVQSGSTEKRETITQVGDEFLTQTEVETGVKQPQNEYLRSKTEFNQEENAQLESLANQYKDIQSAPDTVQKQTITTPYGTTQEISVDPAKIKKTYLDQIVKAQKDIVEGAKFRDPKYPYRYYDAQNINTDKESYSPVAFNREQLNAKLQEFLDINLSKRRDITQKGQPVDSEFKGKKIADLSEDQYQVLINEFNKKYIPVEAAKDYLAQQGVSFDMSKGANIANNTLKGITGVTHGVLSSMDERKSVEADVMNTLYAQAKNHDITKAEYEKFVDYQKNAIEKDIQDGYYISRSVLPGVDSPVKESYDNKTGLKTYVYSEWQVRNWIDKMPDYDKIQEGTPSPYTYEHGLMGKKADAIDEFSRKYLKTNPLYQESLGLTKIPQLVGTLGAYAAAGAINPLFAGAVGAASLKGDTYIEAIQNGATPENAIKASNMGAVAGSIYALPLSKYAGDLAKAIGVSEGNILAMTAAHGIGGFTQQAGVTLTRNATANALYDQTRKVTEGLGEEGLTNAAIAMLFHVVPATLKKVTEQKEIAKAEGDKEKVAELTQSEETLKSAQELLTTKVTGEKTEIEIMKGKKAEMEAKLPELEKKVDELNAVKGNTGKSDLKKAQGELETLKIDLKNTDERINELSSESDKKLDKNTDEVQTEQPVSENNLSQESQDSGIITNKEGETVENIPQSQDNVFSNAERQVEADKTDTKEQNIPTEEKTNETNAELTGIERGNEESAGKIETTAQVDKTGSGETEQKVDENIFVGGHSLSYILDGLKEHDKNIISGIFSDKVKPYNRKMEGANKMIDDFVNPEDIQDVLDSKMDKSNAQFADYGFYNEMNYNNVKDAIRYYLEEKNTGLSDKGKQTLKEISDTLENPPSSNDRLYYKDTPTGIKEVKTTTSTPEKVQKTEITLEDRIAKKKADIAAKKEQRGSNNIINDENKKRAELMADYTDLAILYIQKGLKSAAEFAKELGEDLSDFIHEAWNNAHATQNKESSVKNATTREKRVEFGIASNEKTKRGREEVKRLADEAVAKGYNVKERIEDILSNGETANDVEIELIGRYMAGKEGEIRNVNKALENVVENGGDMEKLRDQRDALISELNDAYDAAEKTGTETARALAYRQQARLEDESLANQFIEESQSHGVNALTEAQKNTVIKEHEEIQKVKEQYEAKIKELEQENIKLQAKDEVKKLSDNKAKVKRTHDDFVKERKEIVTDIREKLKKARMEANTTPIPYAKEIFAISPDVIKLAKSFVDEGVTELADVISKIHATIGDEKLTHKDIQDVLAGEYNTTRTKKQINKELYELKKEAKLQNQLSDALAGKKKATTEKKQIEANRKIKELQDKIKGARNSDAAKLERLKKKTQEEITKVQGELDSGQFLADKPKRVIKLDKEALKLKDELIKLKAERRTRRAQADFERRSKKQKALDKVTEVVNTARVLMTSFDFSAPLRQGLFASVAHPLHAKKAFAEMFKQSVSEKRFQRFLEDIRESDIYPLIEQAKLHISDPHNPRLSLKEEQFMTNLAEKIPGIGKLIRGSERAYISYLNHLRFNIFKDGVDVLESSGFTYANAPEKFNALAHLTNVMTGRGKLGALEGSAQALNTGLFSPRLISSRLTLLNPVFYVKLPKEVRVMAIKNMAKFLGFAATILTLSKIAGASVDDDPRSTDFGKIRVGNTRWDVLGGFSQYIRVLSQFFTASAKNTETGEIKSLNSYGHTTFDPVISFARGKLAPVPSFFVDLGYRKDITGNPVVFNEPTTVEKAALERITPMIYGDVHDAMKEQGLKALLTVGIPSMFGIGTQTYGAKESSGKPSMPKMPSALKMPEMPK